MAGPFKGTFFFQQSGFAWTESWYINATNMDNALEQLDAGAEKRAAMIGSGGLISQLRVTDTTTPRVAQLKAVNYPGPPDSTLTTVDTAYNGIYVRATDVSGLYRRQMWLRGIPDSWIMFDQITKAPIINPLATNAIRAFTIRAIGQGFQMRVINADLTANPRRTITALALQAMTNNFVVTAPGHGFATSAYVRIKNCKGSNLQVASGGVVRGVNGVWPVTVLTPDTFTIPLIGSPTNPPIYTGGGYAQARPIIYVGLRQLTYVRFAKRDTGNPSGRVRGRRRVQRQSQFTPAAGS